jgi:hypothetical protein
MEYAILVFAYKYAFQRVHHMAYFTRDCYIFAHTDKKGKVTKDEKETLVMMPQMNRVYPKVPCSLCGIQFVIK